MFQGIKDITDTTKEEGVLEWQKFLHCISHCSICHCNNKKNSFRQARGKSQLKEDIPCEACYTPQGWHIVPRKVCFSKTSSTSPHGLTWEQTWFSCTKSQNMLMKQTSGIFTKVGNLGSSARLWAGWPGNCFSIHSIPSGSDDQPWNSNVY
jgi:hypothetical protein